MEGPGLSLFQGSDSIKLNTSNQREEEEFLEEEKKRNAELQDLFAHAFNDLDEEDEADSSVSSSHCSHPERNEFNHIDHLRSTNDSNYSTDNSHRLGLSDIQAIPVNGSYSANFVNHQLPFKGNGHHGQFADNNHLSAHRNHCYHSNSSPVQEYPEVEAYKQTDLNGSDQIKVLYEVRLREIERLKKELEAEKEEKVQILRKLALCEHDKKNLEISLNANKTLLAESRTRISELQNEVSKLNDHIKEIERSKDEVRSELEITKTQLFHEQQKFAALERSDLNAKREKQMDMVIESLKSKHNSEMNALEKKLDATLERVKKKDADYYALEKKLDEMEQKHAEHLLNKCETAMRQETTFKTLLEEANKEKQELTRQITVLQQECAMLKNDLEQYDSFPSLRLNENTSSDEKSTDSFILMSSGWRTESKKKGLNLNHTDLVNKLKEELHRAINGQKTKRKEIMKLQEQVQTKELQISKLKEQERVHISQMESLKGEMNKLLNRPERSRTKESDDTHLLAKLQSDIVELEKENSIKTQKILSLEKELKVLKEQLLTAAQTNRSYSEEYMEFYEKELSKLKEDSESLLKNKELEWGREMEKIVTECDDVKKLYLDIKNKKDDLSKKLVEVTKLYEEVKEQKANLESELFKKQQEVKELEDHILLIGKDKNFSEESKLRDVEKELNSVIEKQNAEIIMLKSNLHDAANTDEVLKQMKNEIAITKSRYVELERTLREEFQDGLVKLKEENYLLKETLKKKEAELSLRKLCIQSQKSDVAIGTEDSFIIEKLNEQNLDAIHKLEKEVDRLRALDEAKTQEILRLSSTHEHLLNEELLKLENRLTTQHEQELLQVEKKMKDLSLKYFSEEIEKLQKQHSDNLKALRDEDYKKLTELQQLLSRKEEEVRILNIKKEQLEAALKKYEDERAKAGLLMTQWAKEVEIINEEKYKLNEDMEQLKLTNAQITEAYDQLKLKLKETKKAGLVYKRRLQEVRSSLTEKYRNLMIDLQKKVDDIVSAKEVEIRGKLLEIENEYKNKGKFLHLEDKKNDIR